MYLDTIGTLPTPEEARRFLGDPSSERRARLIDELLERPEFADFWALKWADLLRNEEKTMGAKGVWIFQRWLRDLIERDVPLDEMVRIAGDGPGLDLGEPGGQLLPHEPGPGGGGRGSRAGVSGHPPAVCAVP